MKNLSIIMKIMLKKRQLIIMMMTMIGLSSYAENRWNIYAAGSLTHDCGGYFYWNADGNTNFNWGGGAILGGGYELNFNKSWSFSPAIEISYTDNGAYYNKTGEPAYSIHRNAEDIWTGSWAVNIPLTAGFRFPVSDAVRLKIDAGAYLSEAFHVKHFVNTGTNEQPELKKKKVSPHIGEDFQVGVIGGVAVETGSHMSYFFQTRYPLLDKRWSTANITLSLGIKYSF